MKKIQTSFALLLAALTTFWLFAEGFPTVALAKFGSSSAMLYGSGILAIGAMSASMILAMRLKFLEPWLGGLDKMYRLHKWLGITALVFSVLHWFAKQAPFLFSSSTGVRPPREAMPEQTNSILAFFQTVRGPAEGIGNPAFYALILLVVLALVKWFPYKYFFKTHRILAVVYLTLVFHSLVLMKFTYWGSILGPVMAVLMLFGTIGAFMSLFRLIGAGNRATGKITGLSYHSGVKVVHVDAKLSNNWPGHMAGQFAFVTFDNSEGPHPFTITSHWNGDGDGEISFLVKELGDYTAQLPKTLKVGSDVTVEGPYGEFNFESGKKRQIWICGGIGVAPFVARMNDVAAKPDGRTIDLFHATADYDESAISALKRDVAASGVKLHLSVDAADGYLTADKIIEAAPDWRDADIWFCGPTAMGEALRSGLAAKGMSADNFHAELFDMR
jgi:predicted ferric reductase